MGDQDHAAGIFAQMAFQPAGGFGIQMIGRLVEQQNVGRIEQQPAQRHPAPLAARQRGHVGRAVGAAQRIHRLVDLAVEIPKPLRLDLVLQLGHLVGGFVGVIGRDLVEAVEERLLRRHAQHDVAAHVERSIELRLLRQIADPDAVGRPGLAGEFLVHPRHDPHQGGLAGAVDADDTDLGPGIERQPDVF